MMAISASLLSFNLRSRTIEWFLSTLEQLPISFSFRAIKSYENALPCFERHSSSQAQMQDEGQLTQPLADQ
jgi:hypothetical protein